MLILSLLAPAEAARHEVSVETGAINNGDDTWNLFSESNTMPSSGVRLGAAVHDRVAITTGWHHVRRGATVSDGFTDFRSAFFGNELTLGAKVDIEAVDNVVYPYLSLQGLVMHGQMRFDGDPETKENGDQLKRSAWAPGGLLMGGVELQVMPNAWSAGFAWHLEMGYGHVNRLDFGDLGDMKPGGFIVRTGVGVRF